MLDFEGILEDQMFGPALIRLTDSLKNSQATLRLVSFRAQAPLNPLEGELILTFDEKVRSAEGRWSTDAGTIGTCKIQITPMSIVRWWARLSKATFRLLWMKRLPAFYGGLLVLFVVLDLIRIIRLSYPSLILLLLPAPYVFRNQLAQLIGLAQVSRIRRIGPIEFEQNPLTEDIRLLISQQVQEAITFLTLDGVFVQRTKVILVRLATEEEVSRVTFIVYASNIGVPPDNIEVTLNVLVGSGCATLQDGKLAITELGKRYVSYLTRQTGRETTT